ncbi:jg6024 [Pararge aegeria aegeria]|uniref:Jg6024 protein n=1 Tax=Pararge aegeria aegeria TaxID=348720 RepID=A0A8S4QHW6_9NEOP|nr:jg6024 [Pararge aegeria aegeria]
MPAPNEPCKDTCKDSDCKEDCSTDNCGDSCDTTGSGTYFFKAFWLSPSFSAGQRLSGLPYSDCGVILNQNLQGMSLSLALLDARKARKRFAYPGTEI